MLTLAQHGERHDVGGVVARVELEQLGARVDPALLRQRQQRLLVPCNAHACVNAGTNQNEPLRVSTLVTRASKN